METYGWLCVVVVICEFFVTVVYAITLKNLFNLFKSSHWGMSPM